MTKLPACQVPHVTAPALSSLYDCMWWHSVIILGSSSLTHFHDLQCGRGALKWKPALLDFASRQMHS